jgi:hypothetical protein
MEFPDDPDSNTPTTFPCEVTIQQTYETARLEMGDDYNEGDEDGLLGVLGESRTTLVIGSLDDVPEGYEIIDFDESEPTEEGAE